MDKKQIENKYEVWYWEPKQTKNGIEDFIPYKSEPMDKYSALCDLRERMYAMYTLGKDVTVDGMVACFYVDGDPERMLDLVRVNVDLGTRAKYIDEWQRNGNTSATIISRQGCYKDLWNALKTEMFFNTRKNTRVSIRNYATAKVCANDNMSLDEAMDYLTNNIFYDNIEIAMVTEVWRNDEADYIDRFIIYLDTKEISNNEKTE